MKRIESVQNALVKHLALLQTKSKTRKQTQTFLIEGFREIHLALKSDYVLDTVLFVPEIVSEKTLNTSIPKSVERIALSGEVYQKLAYRDTTEGILAVAHTKPLTLDLLKLPDNPLILIAEAIEKPGNLGALLRTADAARLDAVLVANPKTDLYNPNVIRSSVGCLFTNQIATGSITEIVSYLRNRKISIFCATLQEASPYYLKDYTTPTALVVGTEATGISRELRELADGNIIIPMQGQIDSMNVSVAASILIFEAKRQRGFR